MDTSDLIQNMITECQSLTLLYVEDNQELSRSTYDMLKPFFQKIVAVYDGQEGLDAYGKMPFDIVLTDIMMPNLDGRAMSRQIRNINPDQAVIVMSAHDDGCYLLELIDIGISKFVLKPTSLEDLFGAIVTTAININNAKKVATLTEQLKYDLAENKDILRTIIDTVPMHIFWKDKNSKYLGCNTSFAKESGKISPQNVIGLDDYELGWKEHADFYRAEDRSVMETGIPKLFFEEPRTTPEGDITWRSTSKVPLRNDAQEIIGVLGIYEDITKRKEAEEELTKTNLELTAMGNKLRKINEHLTELVKEESAKIIQKEKMLMQQSKMAAMGEMVGMIAHQWRQPLNALSAAAIKVNVLNELGTLTSEELTATMTFIQEMSQKMSATIKDFMEFAKPDREKEYIAIKDVVNDTLKMMSPQLSVRNIEVNIEIDKEVKLEGYKKELSHVVLNCLANARDAFENKVIADKRITIRAYEEGDDVIIQIGDNAGGIEGSIIDRVFDPFFTTKSADKGTGLGLYMSKKIIEEHFRGSIRVGNADNGAEFEIWLPKSSTGKAASPKIEYMI